MRIDVHAHYYPPELLKALGSQDRVSGGAGALPAGKTTLEERLDMMTDVGIDLQVLCVGANQPAFAKREEAVAAARFANDLYTDVSKGYKGRFAAFAATPLPHVDAAIEE